MLHELGAEAYTNALAEHRRVIREVCARHGGVEVDTQGDAFFFAFPTAPGALAAARELTEALASGPVRVRIGLHTGTPLVTEEGYVGPDVHRAARIAAAGHGGQVLVSASTATLVEIELRDLGEHQLKDLAEAERVYQLGDGDFPALNSLYRTNLPVPATPFLGRERELAEVLELLAREDVRLLTLTGPGGTGKTRLALQAAAEASDGYPDGITWVPLAPLRDPSLLLPAVAHALELREEPGKPLSATLAAALADKHALLVVDNAEHLLPEAARDIAALRDTNGPTLLVTSRERLQVQGERELPVFSMDEEDALELFGERAAGVGVSLDRADAVTELVERLDRLPLALELAAARLKVFSARQLLDRLSERLDLLKGGRDADPRQQTLRATIDWSYDLLEEDEQRLFRGLAVFAGGCTYEAAEEVCGADPDTLQSLIDKSLVRRRDTDLEPRYWMLETIREYAAERLEQSGEMITLRLRHGEWCCELAERLVRRPRVDEGFGSFVDDHDNVRSALGWAWAGGEDELGLRLGVASSRFWMLRGFFRDAASWLDAAEPKIPPAAPRVRLQALKLAGVIAFLVLDDGEQADGFWARALAIAEELGEADDVAWIEDRRAEIVWGRGDLEQALVLHERSLSHHRATGNRLREAESLHRVGETLRDLGRFDEAEGALLDADAILRELDEQLRTAINTRSLADLALDRGDLDAAIDLDRKSVDVELRHGIRRDVAPCLAGMASALVQRGHEDTAATVWGAVCAAEEALGFRMMCADRRRYESRLAGLEGTAAWIAGRKLTLDEAVEYALASID